MGKRRNRGYLIPHLLKAPFGKRHTVSFPFGPLKLPASYRGQVIMHIELCVGCGRCVQDCPTGSLRLERLEGRGVRMVLYQDLCASCGQCEASCRTGAIQLDASYAQAAVSRDALRVEWVKPGRPEGK